MRTWGLIFDAHPQLHWFPWSVLDATPNRNVLRALGVQAFQSCKKVCVRPLLAFVDRLEAKVVAMRSYASNAAALILELIG